MERTYPSVEALASAIDALHTLLAHIQREHVTPVDELKEASVHLNEAGYYLHVAAKRIQREQSAG